MIQRAFVILAFFFLTSVAHGKKFFFYLPHVSRQADLHFTLEHSQVLPGDIIIAPDGEQFTFVKHLNLISGADTNYIMEVEPSRAYPGQKGKTVILRLPRDIPDRLYISQTIQGYGSLNEHSVPVPQLYHYRINHYAVQEKVNVAFTADQFFGEPSTIDKNTLKKAEKALVKFGTTLAPFVRVGDFRSDQIAYDAENDRWVLLDWTGEHRMLGENFSLKSTPFTTSSFNLFADKSEELNARSARILQRVNEAIFKTRRSLARLSCVKKATDLK